jgi:hypothetical protein
MTIVLRHVDMKFLWFPPRVEWSGVNWPWLYEQSQHYSFAVEDCVSLSITIVMCATQSRCSSARIHEALDDVLQLIIQMIETPVWMKSTRLRTKWKKNSRCDDYPHGWGHQVDAKTKATSTATKQMPLVAAATKVQIKHTHMTISLMWRLSLIVVCKLHW